MGVWPDAEIAIRIAQDVDEGWLVNVGIGMPQIAVEPLNHHGVMLHSENGIIGLGPSPVAGEEDGDVIDAGKGFATIVDGGSFIDSATSFMLIRGGRLDLALMGAYEVSTGGDLANWRLSGKKIAGIGGAADLAFGASRVWIVTTLFSNTGMSKLVRSCSHPLTAPGVVKRIYTEYGVFAPAGDSFRILSLPDGISTQWLLEKEVPISAESRSSL